MKVDNSNKIIVHHCLTDRKSSTLELAKKYKQLYGIEFYASSWKLFFKKIYILSEENQSKLLNDYNCYKKENLSKS